MTIFDYLKDIVVTKKGDLPLEQYVPFLVTRWLSFTNPNLACYMNSFNQQVLLENKDLHYKTLIAAVPKMKYLPKMTYIKKVKEKEQVLDPKIKILADQLELSQKEINYLCSLV